jgi:hypothetical protein
MNQAQKPVAQASSLLVMAASCRQFQTSFVIQAEKLGAGCSDNQQAGSLRYHRSGYHRSRGRLLHLFPTLC